MKYKEKSVLVLDGRISNIGRLCLY